MATTNKKPATAFRCGNVNAAVWENTGENGMYFSVTFSRPYKDAQGNWKNSASYGLNDLDALSSVAEMAKEWDILSKQTGTPLGPLLMACSRSR